MKNLHWKQPIVRFLTAQTISLLGSSIVQYAIIWYITLSTSSGNMLMISTLCAFLPQILISLFAGVWIDRYDRKWMIMLSDTMIAFATLILALLFMAGYQETWLLFVILVIRSTGAGIQTPAVNAIIPQIVDQDKLMKTNGINSTLLSMMMFLSPALSGAILSFASFESVLLIDIITAIIGISITYTIQIKKTIKKKEGTSSIEDIKGGFQYLKHNPLIKHILLFQIVILILISPSAFLTPLMVSRTFGSDIWRLSLSEMTYSLGMIAGGILIASWGGFKKKLNTTMLASAVYGFLMLGLGGAPLFFLYLICNTLIGITSPCYNAPITVTIQERVPSDMHGRIFSFMQIATSCALPFGMIIFGPLADVINIQSILLSCGCLTIFISVLVWKFKIFS